MSGVTVVVVGASLQASRQGGLAAVVPAAAGVVEPVPVPAPTAARRLGVAPRKATPRVASARPAARPAAARTATAPPPARHAAVRSSAPRPAPSPAPPRPTTVTVNGSPADTPYGPVQVQITLRAGHIVRADAIDYPQSGSRDREINSYAIPQLDDEAVQADSAQIDTVSGATYTSDGYRTSLQSALDAAHRAGAR